jgi:hypothetical protein
MSYGDDYVSARLSIDIPENATEGLRAITEQVNAFRTAMEAAIHAEGDVTQYLNNMAEASNRAAAAQGNLVEQLNNYLAVASRSMMMPGGMMGVPGGGATMPFGGMMGTGTLAGGYYAQRAPNPSDVAYQLLRQPGTGDPGAYINMAHQRGMLTAQDAMSLSQQTIQDLANRIALRERAVQEQEQITDRNQYPAIPLEGGPGTESALQRIARANGVVGQVINEMGAGGSIGGIANLGARGMQWAAKKFGKRGPPPAGGPRPPGSTEDEAAAEAGQEGMGNRESGEAEQTPEGAGGDKLGFLKNLAGPLMKFAGALTVGAAIFGSFEKGGAMIQGMRNVASVRGGAAGEGAQVEFKARMLSMNPFISQEQARQIYQSVMAEGYADASGSGADNVISFMQHNLTSMNISVADSAKMLRATIMGTGKGDPEAVAGAVNQLGQELDQIRTLSRQGVMSQPDFRNQVMQMQQQMMAGGASPEAAMRGAQLATMIGSNDQVLKGQFGGFEQSLGGGGAAGAMLLRTLGGAQVPAGLMPQAVEGYLEDTGQREQATANVIRALAIRMYDNYQITNPDPQLGYRNAVAMFQGQLAMYFPGHPAGQSQANARAWYDAAITNRLQDMVNKDTAAVKAQPALGGDNNAYAHPPVFAGGPSPSPVGAPPGAAAPAGGNQAVAAAPAPAAAQRVTVDLTPNAAQLLSVLGPKAATVSTVKAGANQGQDGYQVNARGPGPYGQGSAG